MRCDEKEKDYVTAATFTEAWEAEALVAALERQGVEAMLMDEDRFQRHAFFGARHGKVHVQVPEECYDEARRYLRPEQLAV